MPWKPPLCLPSAGSTSSSRDEGSVGSPPSTSVPVDGPVKVHKLGLHGDIQASRIHHGGEDQALYAYSQDDADYWAAELGATCRRASSAKTCASPASTPPAPSSANAGRSGSTSRWKSPPRAPPAPPSSGGWTSPTGSSGSREAGRVGAYLRVVRTGQLQAGDHIHRIFVPRTA